MKTDADLPAFPLPNSVNDRHHGLSKREYFAAVALQGFIANNSVFAPNPMSGWGLVNCKESDVAEYAAAMADALIAALNKEDK